MNLDRRDKINVGKKFNNRTGDNVRKIKNK